MNFVRLPNHVNMQTTQSIKNVYSENQTSLWGSKVVNYLEAHFNYYEHNYAKYFRLHDDQNISTALPTGVKFIEYFQSVR